MSISGITASSTEKKRLYEISVIRPIIILSLVLNHAFCKIAKGGLRSNDYQLPDLYNWINYFNFEATLELFVLISGYLFAFQTITLKRNYPLLDYTLKKAHRLLLPMLVFGIVYYFCFFFNPETFAFSDFILKLLDGCGHLWFLPMLFWCLILLWLVVHFHADGKITFAVLAALSIVKYLPLPLGFATVTHYAFYAYLGYYLFQQKRLVLNTFTERKWLIPVLWLSYFLLVWLEHSSGVVSITSDSFFLKGLIVLIKGIIELTACICGILALYGTVSTFTESELFELSPFIQKADKLSFGVYIYHQFLLVALYHYTPIVTLVNAWVLPWLGFFISLPLSCALTSLTLRTRLGRYLIG